MKSPNIVFILTDDQRFDTIGALNCPEIDTPNFDRLVRSGLTFTQASIMGGTSGAICMPSRNMILTGRTLFEINTDSRIIPTEHATFLEALGENGYATYNVSGERHTQLFDLVNDPKEMNDLSGDPAYTAELHRMQTEIQQAKQTFSDHQPEYGEQFWKDYSEAGVASQTP